MSRRPRVSSKIKIEHFCPPAGNLQHTRTCIGDFPDSDRALITLIDLVHTVDRESTQQKIIHLQHSMTFLQGMRFTFLRVSLFPCLVWCDTWYPPRNFHRNSGLHVLCHRPQPPHHHCPAVQGHPKSERPGCGHRTMLVLPVKTVCIYILNVLKPGQSTYLEQVATRDLYGWYF